VLNGSQLRRFVSLSWPFLRPLGHKIGHIRTGPQKSFALTTIPSAPYASHSHTSNPPGGYDVTGLFQVRAHACLYLPPEE
jgi:hypothetical protein